MAKASMNDISDSIDAVAKSRQKASGRLVMGYDAYVASAAACWAQVFAAAVIAGSDSDYVVEASWAASKADNALFEFAKRFTPAAKEDDDNG